MTRIALDLDSTLADTRVIAYKLMLGDDHDRDPRESPTWDWPLEEFGTARFLNAMWHSWTLRGGDIPPLEENIATKVERLAEFGTIDIVTAHPDHLGITKAKQEWLDAHSIPYDTLVAVEPEQSKADLGYDIYIDDKPGLPSMTDGAQVVYLYDWPYNSDADGDYVRVSSLEDVIEIERQTVITMGR